MKIRLASAKTIFSLAVLMLVFGSFAAFAQSDQPFSLDTSPLPAPTSPVSDYAGVIDSAAKAALEKRIIDYQKSTGVELAVAVVRTTGDRPIVDYSLAVARGWGIGSQNDDNPGALLLVAIDDRKYFTQISRDLEDELPDGIAGSLQRQYLVPEFKKGNYSKGISDTIDAYIRTIDAKRSGTAAPPPAGTTGRDSDNEGGLYSLFCCLAVFLVIILIIWSNRGKSGPTNRGGGWGGGFGGGGSALPWIIGSAISNAASSGWSSSSSDWGSSSGSSGWGGFSGGGDFGGGGAGGDW